MILPWRTKANTRFCFGGSRPSCQVCSARLEGSVTYPPRPGRESESRWFFVLLHVCRRVLCSSRQVKPSLHATSLSCRINALAGLIKSNTLSPLSAARRPWKACAILCAYVNVFNTPRGPRRHFSSSFLPPPPRHKPRANRSVENVIDALNDYILVDISAPNFW